MLSFSVEQEEKGAKEQNCSEDEECRNAEDVEHGEDDDDDAVSLETHGMKQKEEVAQRDGGVPESWGRSSKRVKEEEVEGEQHHCDRVRMGEKDE